MGLTIKKKKKRTGRGKTTVQNRVLVPDSWSLVRERVLTTTTGLCVEEWHLQMRSCWEWDGYSLLSSLCEFK